MNKKIFFIVALVLMTVVSFGAVSAADDTAIGDTATSGAGDATIADSVQAKFDVKLKDNTVINFSPGKYENVELEITIRHVK